MTEGEREKEAIAEAEKKLSASVIRVRMRSPFYATLLIYAKKIPDFTMPTCATDGMDIFYNPDFINKLTPQEVDGSLLHEVLHAALYHPRRRLTRDPNLWNIAADVVVNGIVIQQDYVKLIDGHVRRKDLEHLHAEEVYEVLAKEEEQRKKQQKKGGQGQGQKGQGKPQQGQGQGQGQTGHGDPKDPGGASEIDDQKKQVQKSPCFHEGKKHKHDSPAEAAERAKAAEAHWKQAVAKATVVQRTSQPGKDPAGWGRIIDTIQGPQIDWRLELLRFLTPCPADFEGYDRRLIHQGLYIEDFKGETVHAYICVDTSGSIAQRELTLFVGEINGILRAYPHVKAKLFFADASLYGPYDVEPDAPLPPPQGGGGTSFVPFFDYLAKNTSRSDNAVAIYLTDGEGAFPQYPPMDCETLWVVLPGGASDDKFPFGRVIRMVNMGDANLKKAFLSRKGRGNYFLRRKSGTGLTKMRRGPSVSGSTALAKSSAPAKNPVAKMTGLLAKSQSLQGKMSAMVKASKKKATPKRSTKKASSQAKKR